MERKTPFDEFRRSRRNDPDYANRLADERFHGRRFAFSGSLQKSGLDCIALCQEIEKKGYLLALETPDIDIFICHSQEDIDFLKSKVKHNATYFVLADFFSENQIVL